MEAGSRYSDVDTSGLIDLLDGLADGRLDPASEEVRSTCGREERMIRSVLRLHPERVRVHRDLVALASAARDCDVDLSISIVEDIPVDAQMTTLEAARTLIQRARPGSQARASITRTDQGCVFRLVVHIEPSGLVDLPASAEVVDEGLVSIEETCASPSEVPSTFQPDANAQRSTHV